MNNQQHNPDDTVCELEQVFQVLEDAWYEEPPRYLTVEMLCEHFANRPECHAEIRAAFPEWWKSLRKEEILIAIRSLLDNALPIDLDRLVGKDDDLRDWATGEYEQLRKRVVPIIRPMSPEAKPKPAHDEHDERSQKLIAQALTTINLKDYANEREEYLKKHATDPHKHPPIERDFEIRAVAGTGGFGVVFEVMDHVLNRRVAIKKVLPERVGSSGILERLEREAMILANLEHPNILPMYGLLKRKGPQDPQSEPAFVMRLLPKTLDRKKSTSSPDHSPEPPGEVVRRLKDDILDFHESTLSWDSSQPRRLHFRRLLQQFIEVCHGIAYAHQRSVVHRDIKPANVVIGPHGETVIIDWGIAKVLVDDPVNDSDLSRPATKVADLGWEFNLDGSGTEEYASPEQMRKHLTVQESGVRQPTDVFALGATLFTLLTGEVPCKDIRYESRFAKFPDWVPLPLREIVTRATAVDPWRRYISPRELQWYVDRPFGVDSHTIAKTQRISDSAFNTDEPHPGGVEQLRRAVEDWLEADAHQLIAAPLTREIEKRTTELTTLHRTRRRLVWTTLALSAAAVLVTVVGLFVGSTLIQKLQELNGQLLTNQGEQEKLNRKIDENEAKLEDISQESVTAQRERDDAIRGRDAAIMDEDPIRAGHALRMMIAASRGIQANRDVSSEAKTIRAMLTLSGEHSQRLLRTYPSLYFNKISGLSKPGELLMKGHTGRVIALWYSLDGSELRSASADGTIRVWDARTHQVTRIIPIHSQNSAGFAGLGIATSDGKHRITQIVPHSPASEISPPLSVGDEIIELGDSESKMEPTSGLDQQGIVKRISGAIGTEVAIKVRSAKNAAMRTMTIRRRAAATSFSPGLLNQFSPDGEWLAFTLGSKQFVVVSTESGRIQWASPQVNGVIAALSFTPDSQQLAWGDQNVNQPGGGTVKISDVLTGQKIHQLIHNSVINGIGFDPTGKKAYARWSSEGSLGELDLSQPTASAGVFSEWENPRGRGVHLTVSSTGKWLFQGGDVRRGGNVVYDVSIRRPAWTPPNGGQVSAAVFDPQDQLIAVSELEGTTRILLAEGGALLVSRNGQSTATVAFAPHREVLAIGEGNDVCLWRYRERDAEVPSQLVNAPNSITAATFDEHSGKLLVARRGINMVGIVSPSLIEAFRHSTGQLLERWPEPGSVTAAVDLSPDGSKAVLSRRSFVLGDPAKIEFVDLDTGKSRTISTDCPNVASVTWTTAGKMYLADDPEANFFKQFESNQSRWPRRHDSLQIGDLRRETLSFAKSRDRLTGLLVNRDGDVVIGLGHTISLRDPGTLDFKREIPVARKHTDLTLLSPDGRWLAVLNPLGETSGESILYELATGRLFRLPGKQLTGMLEPAFSADGTKLLVINNDTSKRLIFRIPEGDSLEPAVEESISGMETSPRSQQDGKSFFLWAGKNKKQDLKLDVIPEGTVVEISAETGKTLRVIGREDGFPTLTSPAADGQSLVSANLASGQLRRWNLKPDWPADQPRWKEVQSGPAKPPFQHDIQALAVSPDGKTLVVALDRPDAADAIGGYQLQTWDYSRRVLLREHTPEPGRVAEIAFLGKEGERIAIRGKRKNKAAQLLGLNFGAEHPLVGFAQCWDHVTGNRISELVTPPLSAFSMPDTTHQYSAVLRQSGFVAFAVQEGIAGANQEATAPTVGIWNLNTGERVGTIPQTVLADFAWIICTCQTPHGERLAVELTGSRHPDFSRGITPPAKNVSETNEGRQLRGQKASETLSKTKRIIISLWDVPRLLENPKDTAAVIEHVLTDKDQDESPSGITTYQNPSDVFTAMTIDSTGTLLAGISVRGECSVHYLPLGLQALQLSRVSGNIFHLSFSADGRSLAVVTQPESIIYPVGPDDTLKVPPVK